MKTESYVERWAREQKENAEQKTIKDGEVKHGKTSRSEGPETKKEKRGRKQTSMVKESDNK